MPSTFPLAVLLAVGVVCFVMLLRFLTIDVRGMRSWRFAWLGMLASLVVLAGCSGGSTTSSSTQTPTATLVPTASTGSTPVPTVATTPGASSADWTTYHYNNARTGYVPGVPDPKKLTRAWKTATDGAVYAEPLVVSGRVIIATENDSLYALDQATGAVQWRTNIGKPVAQATLPCGNIDPLGITGTPVYDPATGLIFAVAELSTANGPQHMLVGVELATGAVKLKRVVDVNGMDPRVHQQRAALALFNGTVYVAFGGLAGDCGNYHGVIVAAHTNGQGPLLFYQVPTAREGGIWASSGPAIDSTGKVYVSVGNGAAVSGDWDHTDSVLRLSATLQLEDGYAPSNWADQNSADVDLGSVGPMLLPNGLVFAAGKDGRGYILRANALGGVGKEAFVDQVCSGGAFGGAATVGSQIFVPCNQGVWQVSLAGTQFSRGWQASGIILPPIVAGHTLYGLDYGGTLYAFNTDNGSLRVKLTLDDVADFTVPHFVTPTVSNGRIFVGTYNSVIATAIG